MRDIRVAAAQFEHRNGDKAYNPSRIEELTRRAAEKGAEIVTFSAWNYAANCQFVCCFFDKINGVLC